MAEKRIIVAIDGFSSSGKSTMARSLARALGYTYIDTGAMYRAVTLYALRRGMIAADGAIDTGALTAALPDIAISFRPASDGTPHTLLNGEDVEREIRGMEVADHVSPVSAIPAVRAALVAKQREMGRDGGVVMDGRDIGTTVFPGAQLKIFLNASARQRAQRRWLELQAKGVEADLDDVYRNISERDHADTTRADSPLRKAEDAIEIDNGNMTLEEQDAFVLELFHRVAGQA